MNRRERETPDAPDEELLALRRGLCRALIQYRKNAALTQVQAAASLEWSIAKLVRIEKGVCGVSVSDTRAMLRLYGVTGEDEITGLTRAARSTFQNGALNRTRKPFAELVKLAGDVTGVNGCVFTPAELAEQWLENPGRVADAIEALKMLRAGSFRQT